MPRRYDSEIKDVGPLAQPLKFEFSGKTAPNRFLKAAMTERLSSWDPEHKEKRGIPSDQLIRVYQRWGEGGLGLILTGNLVSFVAMHFVTMALAVMIVNKLQAESL